MCGALLAAGCGKVVQTHSENDVAQVLPEEQQAKSQARLTGQVHYLQRMALPPDAELEVKLLDVSLADAPSVQLASQQIKPAGQIPIAFVLEYNPAQLVPGHTYAIQARITHQDKLLYITTSRQAVLGEGMATSKLRIQVNPV